MQILTPRLRCVFGSMRGSEAPCAPKTSLTPAGGAILGAGNMHRDSGVWSQRGPGLNAGASLFLRYALDLEHRVDAPLLVCLAQHRIDGAELVGDFPAAVRGPRRIYIAQARCCKWAGWRAIRCWGQRIGARALRFVVSRVLSNEPSSSSAGAGLLANWA
jgi:hypothetical protein